MFPPVQYVVEQRMQVAKVTANKRQKKSLTGKPVEIGHRRSFGVVGWHSRFISYPQRKTQKFRRAQSVSHKRA
jgi:hypothetical protein